ncbi:MAG: hypothetical protein KA045_02835, partial [Burkholderiaceae bacterium]|nr:hypothetical protein [Burkholderiaceae bacterium]
SSPSKKKTATCGADALAVTNSHDTIMVYFVVDTRHFLDREGDIVELCKTLHLLDDTNLVCLVSPFETTSGTE